MLKLRGSQFMSAFSWKMAKKRAVSSLKERIRLCELKGKSQDAISYKQKLKRFQDASS